MIAHCSKTPCRVVRHTEHARCCCCLSTKLLPQTACLCSQKILLHEKAPSRLLAGHGQGPLDEAFNRLAERCQVLCCHVSITSRHKLQPYLHALVVLLLPRGLAPCNLCHMHCALHDLRHLLCFHDYSATTITRRNHSLGGGIGVLLCSESFLISFEPDLR